VNRGVVGGNKLCEKGQLTDFPEVPTAIRARLNYQEERISMDFQISEEILPHWLPHPGVVPLELTERDEIVLTH
jgi:hypothetical protein